MKQNYNYDKESDSLYVYFKEGEEADFKEIVPGINLELDELGNVIGVEILRASRFSESLKNQVLSE